MKLIHVQHGVTFSGDDIEIKRLMGEGWKVFKKEERVLSDVIDNETLAEITEKPVVRTKRKPHVQD